MNTINIKTLSTLFIILLTMVVFNSCKTDDDDDTTPTSASFKLSFDNHVGNEELDYTTIFTDTSGRQYMFTLSRYYISNIRLVRDDNSELTFGDKVVLVKQGVETDFDLGTIEPGMYKGLRFDVGIDSTRNSTVDPVTYPKEHPLAIQTDGAMYWSWASGYRFVNIEGMVDTSATLTGNMDYKMTFHLGSNPLLRSVEITRPTFEAVVGQTVTFVIETDHEAFFNGLDLATENFTKTMDNPLLATRVMNNIQNSFK